VSETSNTPSAAAAAEAEGLPVLPGSPRRAFLRVALPIVAGGVALRLLLLWLAGEPALQKDESGYLYLALAWERFGVLLDAERYLWPPAWPFVLKTCFQVFGRDALVAAKVLECVASAAIGLGILSIADRLGGRRAALFAGIAWALYLPLAAFTHMLWSEPLFLALLVPAVALLVGAQQCAPRGAAQRGLILAGLLFGAALLTKEVAFYLAPLLALGVLGSWLRTSPVEGVRRASLFLLAVAAVIAPWTMRNLDVYGRPVPVGISLGENVYHGLNARYVNFDLAPLARSPRVTEPLERLSRRTFVETDPASLWVRDEATPNTAERSGVHVARGLGWLRANPGDFARTRLKKLADLVAPTCFFVRHQALAIYSGPLGAEGTRQALVAWAVAAAALLLLLGLPGSVHLAGRVGTVPGAWIPLVCGAYFVGTSLLVSMSRFRLCLVPWLIVGAAVLFATERRDRLATTPGRLTTLLALGALGFLWWIDWPELTRILELAWAR